MGQQPIAEVQPADILTFFRQLEAQGIHETGAKIRRALVEAFDLAAFSGRVHANPVRGVEWVTAFIAQAVTNHNITEEDL